MNDHLANDDPWDGFHEIRDPFQVGKGSSLHHCSQRPPSRAISSVVAVVKVDVPRRFVPAMPPRAQNVAVAGVVNGTLQQFAHASAREQLVVVDEPQHQLGGELIYAKCRLLWDDCRQRTHFSTRGSQ